MNPPRIHALFLPITSIILILVSSCVVGAQVPPDVTTYIAPSDELIVDPNGVFIIPKSARAAWRLDVVISNTRPYPSTYTELVWQNRYEAALEIITATADRGNVSYAPWPSNEIEWSIGTLAPGQSATLRIELAVRTTEAGAQSYSEVGCGLWETGAKVHYLLNHNPGLHLSSVHRRCVVEAPPWITISLATRKDWHLRRPGCFAAEAFAIDLASNSAVSVSFEAFADLMRIDDPSNAAIPTWYARGRETARWESWIPAAALNEERLQYVQSSELESGISETFWHRLCVGPEHVASGYQNEGVITVAIPAGSTRVTP